MFCIFRLGKRGSHRCIRIRDTVLCSSWGILGSMKVELPLLAKAGKQLQGKTLAEPYTYHP